jgi:hypothetical protein
VTAKVSRAVAELGGPEDSEVEERRARVRELDSELESSRLGKVAVLTLASRPLQASRNRSLDSRFHAKAGARVQLNHEHR